MKSVPTELYPLSLHDALPISPAVIAAFWGLESDFGVQMGNLPTLKSLVSLAYDCRRSEMFQGETIRSEEHTSELQSHVKLVCRLLLEQKKTSDVELAHSEVNS